MGSGVGLHANGLPKPPVPVDSRDTKAVAAADAKALEQLDDGIRSQVATMFMGRAENDMISLESLYDIVRELALPFEPDQVGTQVTDDEARALTLDRCLVIVGRLVELVHKSRNDQSQEAAIVVTQASQPIVYLNTLDYFRYILPGSQRDENTDYRWQRPNFSVRPRIVLLVCVSTMLVISAFILTLILVLLSRGVAEETQRQEMKTIGASVDHIGGVLVTGSSQIAVMNYLQDSSQGGKGSLELIGSVREALLTNNLEFLTHFGNFSIGSGFAERSDRDSMRMRGQIREMQSIFSKFGSSVTFRVAATRFGSTETNHILIASAPDGSFASGDVCLAAQLASSFCLAGASDGVSHGVGTECGSVVRWVSGRIPRLNISMCILAKAAYDELLWEDSLRSVATSFNNASSRSILPTLGFEIAKRSGGGAISTFGGRNRLPTYCNQNFPGCSQRNEMFSLAMAGGASAGRVVGDDMRDWLASFVRSDVSDWSFIVGAGMAVDALLVSLRRELASVFNHNLYKKAATLLLAYADSLGNPFVIYSGGAVGISNVTLSALTNAVQGRDGLITGDGDDRILSYNSIASLNLAVLSKMSRSQESAAVVSLVTGIASTLQQQLPPGWTVFVFQQSPFTGRAEIVGSLPRPCSPCLRHEAADQAFTTRRNGILKCRDIYDEAVVSEYWYFSTTPPMVVVLQQSEEDLQRKLLRLQWVSAVIAIGITAVALILLVLLTQRVLNRIEGDYNHYKFHIEEEKRKFGDLVKDVMPPGIAQKIMRGTRLIAETHPQLTFFFSDMVGSTETSKTMNNKQLVRMLGYTFMLEDEIASHFNIHKIKTIGDAYFAVSGLEDASGSGQSQGKNHQTYRMVSFACLCQQLFGPEYSHFPERTECFKVSSGGQDLGPMKMVRLRMGIHTGPAVAGVVDVGRAPHFDCFGPSVNLASRMESTATAGRVQISGPSMEILSRIDKDGLFEFENPRKTLVKGYGTMVTYMIKSTNLKVPTEILTKLGIERSSRRLMFHQNNLLAHAGHHAQAGSPHDAASEEERNHRVTHADRPSQPAFIDQSAGRAQRAGGSPGQPIGLVATPARSDPRLGAVDHGMRNSAPVPNPANDAFVYGGFEVALPPPPPDF